MSLDEWLKAPADVPSSVVGEDDDDAMGGGLPDDLPDLGLGTLSAEDIKWVDLEFLDLASGPPANQEKNRNKNPTLGYNFPDIFFGDATFSSSIFNSTHFSLEDFKPFGDSFKDTALDLENLETVEKNILADLFPPTASIEQTAETGADEEGLGEFVISSASASEEVTAQVKIPDVKEDKLSDGVYSVPMDVLQIISKSFSDLQSDFETSEQRPEEEVLQRKEVAEAAAPAAPKVLKIKSIKTTSENDPPPKNAVAKISILTDRVQNTTQVTILPGPGPIPGVIPAASLPASHSFKINSSNMQKVSQLLKPLHLDNLPVFRTLLQPEEKTDARPEPIKVEVESEGQEQTVIADQTELVQIKEIRVVRDQTSVRKLAEHGIELAGGMTCATTESGQRFWMCPEEGCHKAYTRPSKLKIHLLAHKDIKPFRCTHANCTWGFVTNSKLQRHLESHKKLKNFSCTLPGCGSKFTTVYNLHKHIRQHEREPKFRCDVCSQQFSSEKAFVQHLKSHDSLVPGHECSEEGCPERFFSLQELKTHSRTTHHPVERAVCSFEGCGKLFKKPSQLKTHYRIHSGSRPYTCNVPGCDWAFMTASKLKRHERGHNNVRNHVCHVCQKSYLRSEHLRGHLLSHLCAKGLMCALDSCHKRFSSKADLFEHLKIDHAGSSSSSTSVGKRYRCVVLDCKRQQFFPSRQELAHHLRSSHKAEFANQADLVSLVALENSTSSPKSALNSVLRPVFPSATIVQKPAITVQNSSPVVLEQIVQKLKETRGTIIVVPFQSSTQRMSGLLPSRLSPVGGATAAVAKSSRTRQVIGTPRRISEIALLKRNEKTVCFGQNIIKLKPGVGSLNGATLHFGEDLV